MNTKNSNKTQVTNTYLELNLEARFDKIGYSEQNTPGSRIDKM